MYYRAAGLIALFGAPFLFIKLALIKLFLLKSNYFIIIANLGYDVSAVALLSGLLLLSSSLNSVFSRILLLSGMAVICFSCICNMYLFGSVNTHLLLYLENIRCSEGILLSCMGSLILISGKNNAWQNYAWQILLCWMIGNFLIFSMQLGNISYVLAIQSVSSILIAVSGYRVYTSDDPGVEKENMLYEISTL